MSYCRFSTPMCDLYCYEDVSGGFTTHVAAARHTKASLAAIKSGELLKAGDKMEKIGLPHDGESYNDSTIEEFLTRVKALKAAGYMVPDRVIAEIESEVGADPRRKERT